MGRFTPKMAIPPPTNSHYIFTIMMSDYTHHRTRGRKNEEKDIIAILQERYTMSEHIAYGEYGATSNYVAISWTMMPTRIMLEWHLFRSEEATQYMEETLKCLLRLVGALTLVGSVTESRRCDRSTVHLKRLAL